MHPLLLVAVAQAQEPPSPARMCADAAEGTAVEVCLRLASSHPEAVDSIAAALKARIDRAAAPDRELLLATLRLLSPESGADGARELGALGDPRAVPPLEDAAETRSPDVAAAAVRALARYDEGLQPLSRLLMDQAMRRRVRAAAARALGDMQRDEAADVLIDAVRRRGTPPRLRDAMVRSVRRSYPARIPDLDRQPSTDGTGWAIAGGAAAGAWTLSAGMHFTDAGLEPLGATTGTLAGGTAGFLGSRAWPTEAGGAGLVATSGMAGIASGAMIGGTIDSKDILEFSTDSLWLGGITGGVVGYGVAGALAAKHPGSGPDAVEASFVGTATAVMAGTGFSVVDANTRVRLAWVTAGLGLAGGTAAGHLIAPRVQVVGADWGLITLGAAFGTTVGALVPIGGANRVGLPAAGTSVGGLVGYGLSGVVDTEWDVIAGTTGGLIYGTALGYGAGSFVPVGDGTLGEEGALVLGLSGAAAGAHLAHIDTDPLDDRDLILVGYATGFAAWQAGGWVKVLDNPDLVGLVPLLPAAAGSSLAVLSNGIDWPVTNSTAALSLGMWGAYTGATGAKLMDQDPLVGSLALSNVGFAGGVVLLSPWVGTPPLVVAMGDAGGVFGGAAGAIATGAADASQETVLRASLVGAGAGFAGGAIAGHLLHRSGRTRDVAVGPVDLPGHWVVVPTVFQSEEGPQLGASMQVQGW